MSNDRQKKESHVTRKLFAVLAGVMVFAEAAAQGDGGRYGGASALERAQLPKYCYALHVDSKLAGHPEYDIPRSCGPYMNHLCEGLIYLIRAQKVTAPLNQRRGDVGIAVGTIQAALNSMNRECPIRADVEAALARAKIIQAGLR